MIDRQEFSDELTLRECIRKVIKIVLEKRLKEDEQILLEENTLRKIIRKLISEETEAVQRQSTVERDIAEVLEQVVLPELFPKKKEGELQDKKGAYEKLEEPERRRGFFAGFLAFFKHKFEEYDAIGDSESGTVGLPEPIEEAIEVDIDDSSEEDDLMVPLEQDVEPEPEELLEPVRPPESETAEYKHGYQQGIKSAERVIKQSLEVYQGYVKAGDIDNAAIFRDWLLINIGLHMYHKEKEITGSFPELPPEFAAEIEKFRTEEEYSPEEELELEPEEELPPGEEPIEGEEEFDVEL